MDSRKQIKLIDPLTCSKDDKKLLCMLMQQNPHTDLNENHLYSIVIHGDRSKFSVLKLMNSIKWCKTDGMENYYEIHQRQKPIGKGGFGLVLPVVPVILTRDGKLKYKRNKDYVVKEQKEMDKEYLPRSIREVDLMRRLKRLHAKPLQIKKLPSGKLTTIFRMRFIPGKELFSVIRDDQSRAHPLTFLERLNITINLLYALQEVHAAGVVHRDIKPENILSLGEKVCLIDFGLSQALEHLDKNECSGSVLYAPPELFLREETYPPADIFSLGMTLRLLWRGIARKDEVINKLHDYFLTLAGEPYEQLFAGLADVPRDAADAIYYCLKSATLYSPAARPTIDAMLDCFELVKMKHLLRKFNEPLTDEIFYCFEEAQYLRRSRGVDQHIEERVSRMLRALEKISDSKANFMIFNSFIGYDFINQLNSLTAIKGVLQNFISEHSNLQQSLAKHQLTLDAISKLVDETGVSDKLFHLKLDRIKTNIQHWQKKLLKGVTKDCDEFKRMLNETKKISNYYDLKVKDIANHPLVLMSNLQTQLSNGTNTVFNTIRIRMVKAIKSELQAHNKNPQQDLRQYQALLRMLLEARNVEELKLKFSVIMPKKIFSFFRHDEWRDKLAHTLNDPIFNEGQLSMPNNRDHKSQTK